MKRSAALLWLVFVLVAGGSLSLRLIHGLNFQSDLMALLPQEEQNPAIKRTNDIVTQSLSRHVVFLVGDHDRNNARAAAQALAQQLNASGHYDLPLSNLDQNQLKQMGAFYYPYRAGLLSDEDRASLSHSNGGQGIATRALAQIYGGIGFANAQLLHGDPFLLMPSFLTGLPIPLSRLSLDDGLLSLQDQGVTWVLVAGQINDTAFALDSQKKTVAAFDNTTQSLRATYPTLEILHLGAVFFAHAGAQQAMGETTAISIISTLGTLLLIIGMFRAVRPLLLSLLVIGVGVGVALATSLWIFGELHVGALLFGISLIGVSVDYSLQYCSEIFTQPIGTPHQRLQRVFAGITLGAATTIIGYLTLMLAPFPGLHQIAAFSAVGLLASWLTVVLWVPFLDQKTIPPRRQPLHIFATYFLSFWENPAYHKQRLALLMLVFLLGVAGATRFHSDDDVRRMQSLAPNLVAEQAEIQKRIGTKAGSQFFIVEAPTDETALQAEEQLAEKLRPLVASGALSGFQSPASFIPSQSRQDENRKLQQTKLYQPLLTQQTTQLGLKDKPETPDNKTPYLTIDAAQKQNTLPAFLSTLLINKNENKVTHLVSLDAVTQPDIVAAAAQGITGVRYVDPAHDFSTLLAKYRNRALILLALSALLMAPLLVYRYGFRKGLWIMVPPLMAVCLAPALRSLTGSAFSFFDAMALVLVLSVGVDYAVFCAETSGPRKPVTIFAVTMAACTALLSFGLLALSQVTAVHNFGSTMSLGILFSYLFAPMARWIERGGGKKNNLHSLIPLAFIMLLAACASAPTETPTNIVPLAPNLTLTLPNPATLGRTVEATQMVTAHYGDQVFAFEAHINATQNHFLLVGLDLMGRKLMTIDWTPNDIHYETASWVPPTLHPENILGDIVLLYWPAMIVQQSLSGGKLVATAHNRTIVQDNKKIWQADYNPQTKNIWDTTIVYRNLAWGYHFEIQSVETSP